MNKIIAIDFDDTITLESPFPITGKLNEQARKYIWELKKKGYTLVLWTSRKGNYYKEALNLIKSWKLPIEEDNDKFKHGESGKIVADFYIDDKSITGKINWKKIYEYIITYIV